MCRLRVGELKARASGGLAIRSAERQRQQRQQRDGQEGDRGE